jgi:3-hydroxymyristoyl/3-hydroxydecanoyl-(acyl carrier protein) dehydratase
MRYRFVDEVLELTLEDPARIETAKTFTRGDDVLSGPLGPDRVPNSMLLELQAMAAGHLLFQRLARRVPLLLKVEECRFDGRVRPDTRLQARADLHGVTENGDGSATAGVGSEVFAGGVRLAWSRLLFVCVPSPAPDLARFEARP